MRNPKPDTPGDTVVMLIDANRDGVADTTKTFASGLNSIQGLAWHGRDLWIGNSPDLTIVRDLDGDDRADEYVKVYTDLGNLEHANHGHTWAPDGKLYFSQGTSKGLTQPGRVAPKPFRDLWGVQAPAGRRISAATGVHARHIKATYQDPGDDWGREGGVLRSDDMGANLEIVSRGSRNPWDIAFDSGFNWLGTDNDQSEGDRVFMPFFGAHFGWGHVWSNHWTGADHAPTAPISGPVFDGSGTGSFITTHHRCHRHSASLVLQRLAAQDHLRVSAAMGRRADPAGRRPLAVIRQRRRSRPGGCLLRRARYRGASVATALFRPVDIVAGPDGALYVSGWGEEYGAVWKDGEQANEGRISGFRGPLRRRRTGTRQSAASRSGNGRSKNCSTIWVRCCRSGPSTRRTSSCGAERQSRTTHGAAPRQGLTQAQETWALWTLGRMALTDRNIDAWFAETGRLSLNASIQAIRIAAHRIREHRSTGPLPAYVVAALQDAEPRLRFAAVQAVAQARQRQLVPQLCDLAARENDRVTQYAAWQALREIATPDVLRALLKDERGAVRRAALLALLESRALEPADVKPLVRDRDAGTSEIAANWLAQSDGNPLIDIYPRPGDFVDSVTVRITPGIKPATVRFTLDGSEPPQNPVPAVPGNSGHHHHQPRCSSAARKSATRSWVRIARNRLYLARAGNSRDAHDRRAGPVTSSVGRPEARSGTLQCGGMCGVPPRRQRRPRRWPGSPHDRRPRRCGFAHPLDSDSEPDHR